MSGDAAAAAASAGAPLLGERGGSHAMASGGTGWQHHRPRDVLCLVLFVLTLGAFVAVGLVGVTYGDPDALERQVLNASSNAAVREALEAGKGGAELWAMEAVNALRADAGLIFGLAFGAVVAAALWTAALRAFVKPFLWATAVLGVLAVAFLGAVAIGVSFKGVGDVAAKDVAWLKWVGAFLEVLALCLVVALVILRKHVQLTVVLFEEASRGLARTPSILFACLVVVAAFVGVSSLWLYSFVGLYTVPAGTTTVEVADLVGAKDTTTVTFQSYSVGMRSLMYFQVFGFLWVSAWLSAVFQMTVGGAMTHWYFCGRPARADGAPHPDADRLGGHPLKTLARAATVSAGTAAFGAFILAAVQFLNFVVRVAEKKAGATGNRFAKCCLGCVAGCLGCISGAIKFINRYAYVYCATHGKSFLGGAKACFDLLAAHGLSAVVIHTLGDFVLFLGKLLGVGAFTAAAIFIMNGTDRGVTPISVAAVAFITFFIFNFFARIISVSVDAIFVAYAEDLDRCGGDAKNGAALYCDPAVHHTIQDHAKAKEVTRPMN